MTTRGYLDEVHFIDPLGRDLDPDRDRTAPEGAVLYLRGWACLANPDRRAAGVYGSIDGGPRFDLSYNQDRQDVAVALGLAGSYTIGFHGMWSLAGLARGPHVLELFAIDPDSNEPRKLEVSLPFEIVPGSYAFTPRKRLSGEMKVVLDRLEVAGDAEPDADAAPGEAATRLPVRRGQTVLAHGWAIDVTNRTAASDVYACIDGETFVRGIIGWRRPDAAEIAKIEEAWRCGYVVRIPTRDLAAGPHTIEIRAAAADGAGYETAPGPALDVY